MNQKVLNGLTALGLSTKESQIYTALLELGSATAYRVSKKCGLKTPGVYAVLDSMVATGFVLKIPKSAGHEFMAKKPDELLGLAESKLADFSHSLPLLRALSHSEAGELQILSFRGIDELRAALFYKSESLADTEYVAFYALMQRGDKKLHDLYTEMEQAYRDQNTTHRAIAPDHPSLASFKKQTPKDTKIRWTDQSVFASEYAIDICLSFVRIVMPKEQQAIIIDSPRFATSMQQIFELAWQR